MPLLSELSDVERKMLEYFPAFEHAESPFTPLKKSLDQSRLAIVTTAGVHLRTDAAFLHQAPPDSSYRLIPSDSSTSEIVQSHPSIGFDRTAIYKDLNVTFPIDRVNELAEAKIINSVAKNHFSFHGAQRDPSKIVEKSAPEVAKHLIMDGVDCVLITPT